MAAFRLGAEHGYRMFECDAKLSADGVPFLLHDATLERTTNGTGVAGDQPWSALARLDAGSWHSRAYAGEPLPTLDNIARFCLRNDYFLNIEIKPTPGLEQQTGEVVAREAARLWAGADVPPLLTSFRPEALEGAQNAAAHLRARAAPGHSVERLARDRTLAGLRGGRLQPCALGYELGDAGEERRFPVPELYGQRRMGGAAADRARHRRHHHGPD